MAVPHRPDRSRWPRLRPIVEAGLLRLPTLERDHRLSLLLQGYLLNSPEALVFFDACGEMLYQTAHGATQLSRWNRAIRRNQAEFSLPEALHQAFRNGQGTRDVQHPELPELSAELAVTTGGFVLRLVDRQTLAPALALTPRALAALKALTPAEQRVARLGAEGLRNEQIAERLRRSSRTVEAHFTKIFRKLDVANRVQLSLLLT